MIERHVEEAVGLRRMQGHGNDAIGTRGFDQLGDQFGGYANPRGVFFVRTSIRVVGDDSRHAGGVAVASDVEHHQQLHEVPVHRVRQRLDDVDILAAHAFSQLDSQGSMTEASGTLRTERDTEVSTDRTGKRLVRCPRKNKQVIRSQACPPSPGLQVLHVPLYFTAPSQSRNPQVGEQRVGGGANWHHRLVPSPPLTACNWPGSGLPVIQARTIALNRSGASTFHP